MTDRIWVLLLLALAAGGVWVTASQTSSCRDRGGVLVKGFNGFPECVAAPPVPK